MSYKTVLFSPPIGDIIFPITQDSIDGMSMGVNVPIPYIDVDEIVNSGSATFTGTVSGAGFTAAVQELLEEEIPAVRYLPLTDVRTQFGVPLITATAIAGVPGISRTPGTSLYLNGIPTEDTTPATTVMVWEFVLPDSYEAASNIPVLVNCVVPVAANVVAGSTTLSINAYKVSAAGVETAVTVTSAQQIPITTAAILTFTLTGTGLVAGQRMTLQLNALVTTTAGGASSLRVNSVGFTA